MNNNIEIFIISDEHYFHNKIIEYENRPFKDVHEMNETLIKNYNRLVSNDDIVIHLGDFCFGGKKLVEPIAERLKGNKYLIMGNHDRKRTVTWFKKMGFIKVFKNPIYLKNIILSHEPVNFDELEYVDKLNFHGHIHNNIHYKQFLEKCNDPTKYVNFSVEILNYKPFKIIDENIKKELLTITEL